MGGCWLYSPTLFGLVSPMIFVDTDGRVAVLFLIAGGTSDCAGNGVILSRVGHNAFTEVAVVPVQHWLCDCTFVK